MLLPKRNPSLRSTGRSRIHCGRFGHAADVRTATRIPHGSPRRTRPGRSRSGARPSQRCCRSKATPPRDHQNSWGRMADGTRNLFMQIALIRLQPAWSQSLAPVDHADFGGPPRRHSPFQRHPEAGLDPTRLAGAEVDPGRGPHAVPTAQAAFSKRAAHDWEPEKSAGSRGWLAVPPVCADHAGKVAADAVFKVPIAVDPEESCGSRAA